MTAVHRDCRVLNIKHRCYTYGYRIKILALVVLIILAITHHLMTMSNNCICFDSNGNPHEFCYRPPMNATLRGKSFSCKHLDVLDKLDLLSPDLNMISQPVFVTAFSQSHYQEGRRLIASIRKYWKNVKIVVYDIGLSKRNAEKMQLLCNVEYRKFAFDQYPSYFNDLYTFRWKPIVIAEALRDFGNFWYMDSSVIFTKGSLDHVYLLTDCKKSNNYSIPDVSSRDFRELSSDYDQPWDKVLWTASVEECAKSHYLLHSFSGHGIFPATDYELYNYFPVNKIELKKEKAKMYEAGLAYVKKSDQVVQDIVKWYVLCALQKDCMGTMLIPNICNFDTNNRFSKSADCHRYDQSVLNVLLALSFNYDRHYYSSGITDFFQIQRYIERPVPSKLLRCE